MDNEFGLADLDFMSDDLDIDLMSMSDDFWPMVTTISQSTLQSLSQSSSPSSRRSSIGVTNEPQRRPSRANSSQSSRPDSNNPNPRPHHGTEKKYRAALNDKFNALQTFLLESRTLRKSLSPEQQKQLLDLLDTGRQCNTAKQKKSLVLSKAIEYIGILQKNCESMTAEIDACEKVMNASTSQMEEVLTSMQV